MRSAFLLLFFGIVYSSFAQNFPRREIDLQTLADEWLAYQDEDVNYEDFYENFLQLLSNPINVNTASPEQLRSLLILSENQIQKFITYRNENGELLSEYELQAVPDFDLTTIYKLLPFIKVNDSKAALGSNFINRLLSNENNYLLLRYERTLETRRGFKEEGSERRFLGSPDKLYLRFRNSIANEYSIGFTAEQDAGERFVWKPSARQYGSDFFSFHAQVQNKGRLKNLILGDYQLQSGQGLVLGGAFGIGKGGETITTTRKSNLMALPFTSVTENYFLRGGAATYEVRKNFTLTGFFSHAYRDATTDSDTLEAVSSLLLTGLHRNQQELVNRKQLEETLFGGIANYQYKSLQTGVIYQGIRFSKAIERTPSVYNQFSFSGNSNDNLSIFLNYTFYNFTFFSEAAKSMQGGTGSVLGTIGSLTPKFDIALLYRNYQRNFNSFYSNAFSEASTPQNETGLYWGLKYRFNRKYQLSGYMDFFTFPWLRYRSYAPSEGHEWLVRFQYQPSRTISLYAQVREEAKQRNVSINNPFYLTDVGVKRNLLFNADYSVNRTLQLKTRAQFSEYTFNNFATRGITLLQDIVVDLRKIKISARYALFDTDDYDNRQYVLEKDVWLAYSLPAYYGTGVRQYVMVQYDANKHISLWLRYAHMQVKHVESLGSGLDEIEGNTRNDVKVQMRIKL